MIQFEDRIILENDYQYTYKGFKFYEVLLKSALAKVTGKNVVCLAGYKNLNYKKESLEFTHISFHETLEDFYKTDQDWAGIHFMPFRSVKDKKEGLKIIERITKKE